MKYLLGSQGTNGTVQCNTPSSETQFSKQILLKLAYTWRKEI